MATETHTLTPSKLFAGDFPKPITAPVTVLTGQDLAALTIVETNLTGEVIAHAGINEADDTAQALVAGVLINAVDATAADLPGLIYEGGCFFASQLVWPADCTDNLLKRKLLEGSLIKVVFQDTGEV